jgi:DNA polymerase delta subunit 1
MESENQDYDVEMGEGPESEGKFHKWCRPDLPPLDPAKDPVVFQQIDIDHYSGNVMRNMPGAQVS